MAGVGGNLRCRLNRIPGADGSMITASHLFLSILRIILKITRLRHSRALSRSSIGDIRGLLTIIILWRRYVCGFIDGEQSSVHFYLNFGYLVFCFMLLLIEKYYVLIIIWCEWNLGNWVASGITFVGIARILSA